MDEQSYKRGQREAHIRIMQECVCVLGVTDPATEHISWIAERQAVVSALRDLCEDFGDNDWPDESHLGDVIEKHLAPHIHMACPIKKTPPLFHELSGGICNRK